MARLVVMYKTPADPEAFDKYYFENHIPLAKTIPSLRKFEVNRGPIFTPAGPAPYHLIATLHYDTVADIQAAFESPLGQKVGADMEPLATAGADVFIYESDEV